MRTDEIHSGTYTDLQRSQAQHVRNGYHRVLARTYLRKTRGEWPRGNDKPSTPNELDCTAHPNPFASSTIIAWTMHERDHAMLRVYDALGREVLRATDAVLEMGRHSIELHRRDLAPGLYFVHVRTSTQKAVLRVLLEPFTRSR